MLTYVITNILLLLRTIELCIFNSVSISGGQLIMYPQLIFKRKEGKNQSGLRGENMHSGLWTEIRPYCGNQD
jgi:hypothetical protein